MRSLCIVPVFNQATELPKLIEKFRAGVYATGILFVDDGSTDGTAEIIAQSGFPYVRTEKRQGIGHALIVGTRYAFKNGYHVIVHMAGNGKMLPSEMHRVLEPLQSGRADYVWGSRFLKGGNFENAPTFRRIAIPWVFNQIPWLATGQRLTDATCGFRAYRLSILEKLVPDWDRPWLYKYEFEYYVLGKVLKSRYRWKEVPISMVYPKSGKNYSKITPVISWWSMLKPWLVIALGLDKWLSHRIQLTQLPAMR